MTTLQQAISNLVQANADFSNNKLSSVEFSNVRQTALAEGLRALATKHGITLQEPLHIDSNGEFSIVAESDNPSDRRCGFTAHYGEAFAALLNKHRPRTGIAPGSVCAENGWCRMNHFDVERLVMSCQEPPPAQPTSLGWIEDPEDPELQRSWQVLIDQKGDASGWQYRGSALTETGWVHSFRNRQLLEEAESPEDEADAYMTVPAAEGWVPALTK